MIWKNELEHPAPLDVKVLVFTHLEDIFMAMKCSPSIMCPQRWVKMRNWFADGPINHQILFWSKMPTLEEMKDEMFEEEK